MTMKSDRYDLGQLGLVPYDIGTGYNPHRYHTPEETRRLIEACREDDRRCDADTARWEAVNAPAVQWDRDESAPISRPVFVRPKRRRRLTLGAAVVLAFAAWGGVLWLMWAMNGILDAALAGR
jgi:hypothetical protein